ncbi:MAG TPA: hypothetical protein VGK10_01115 [Prolixibacteraceae bacterium]|jgi:hypothetical protein
MNTKLLMTSSAVTLGLAGVILTFMPEEILSYSGMEASKLLELMVQIVGALYFGFSMLNWMTKSGLIGGIYNRPIVIANFTHFFIVAMALIKAVMTHSGLPFAIWIMGVLYTIFAISFGTVLFRNPTSKIINTGQIKL